MKCSDVEKNTILGCCYPLLQHWRSDAGGQAPAACTACCQLAAAGHKAAAWARQLQQRLSSGAIALRGRLLLLLLSWLLPS